MKSVEFNHNHWKLSQKLRRLLTSCAAKEQTRYALNGIGVTEKTIAATDGRRLIVLEKEHGINPGIYFVTQDGWLLERTDGKFPKYEDVIPAKDKLKLLAEIDYTSRLGAIAVILGELVHAKCICDIGLLYGPGSLLGQVEISQLAVYVDTKDAPCNPFLLEGSCCFGKLQYLQMPVNWKKE